MEGASDRYHLPPIRCHMSHTRCAGRTITVSVIATPTRISDCEPKLVNKNRHLRCVASGFFLPASTCDVPHETFVAGLPPRRLDGNLCPSRAAIALRHRPEKSLASQLRQKRLEVYCTNTISETPSRECRRDTGEAREPKLVVYPRPISRRIPFALLVLSGYQP